MTAVLFAIENITEGYDFEFSNATELERENSRKYIFNSLEWLDANQLKAFIKEFVNPVSSESIFNMETFIKKSLNEENTFNQEVYRSETFKRNVFNNL